MCPLTRSILSSVATDRKQCLVEAELFHELPDTRLHANASPDLVKLARALVDVYFDVRRELFKRKCVHEPAEAGSTEEDIMLAQRLNSGFGTSTTYTIPTVNLVILFCLLQRVR